MQDAWTEVQIEVEGIAPSSRDGAGVGVGTGKPAGRGVVDAKIASRGARPLLVVVGGVFTRLEVGVDEADVEAEAKWVSRLTLLLSGVGAGEADGMRLENHIEVKTSTLL